MPQRRSVLARVALALALVAGLGGAGSGGAKTLEHDAFAVVYSHMTDAEAHNLFERARDGYAAVVKYLDLRPSQKIVIKDVDLGDQGNGRTTIPSTHTKAKANAPIQIDIPLRYLRHSPFKTAVVHELTHAVAGHPFKRSAFLAEGLAVHVNGVLARSDESDSFVNYPIHAIAQRHLRRIVVLDPIQHLIGTREIFSPEEKMFGSGYTRETGYVFAGSFVTFLVQRDGSGREDEGLARFMSVYRDGDFEKAYGKPLSLLEREWMSFVRTQPAPRYRAAR